MRKIEAVIRPDRFNAVKAGLAKYGVRSMTVSEVFGCGRQPSVSGFSRGKEYTLPLMPRLKLEIVVAAAAADEVVALLREYGWTGEVGDGLILVFPVEHAVRIRTGKTGKDAL